MSTQRSSAFAAVSPTYARGSWGNDDQITIVVEDRKRLETKIRHWAPRIVAFTSKKAAASFLDCRTGDLAYGLQEASVDDTKLFVLPSPSGQASRYWDLGPWRELGRLIEIWRKEN